MQDDDKIFHIGMGLMIFAVVLTAVLQVCHRVQDRALSRIRAEIVRTQKETADAQARYSAYLRPEVLRGIIADLYPDFVPIGAASAISAADIEWN